jgi:hypothetical protein
MRACVCERENSPVVLCEVRDETEETFQIRAYSPNTALCEARAEAKEAVEPRGYEIAQADGSMSMDDSNSWFARGIGDDRQTWPWNSV